MVERENHVCQEMMHETPIYLWVEAIQKACYTSNGIFLRLETNKTSYELWSGKKPNLKYFKTFDSESYILRNGENLGKFIPNSP